MNLSDESARRLAVALKNYCLWHYAHDMATHLIHGSPVVRFLLSFVPDGSVRRLQHWHREMRETLGDEEFAKLAAEIDKTTNEWRGVPVMLFMRAPLTWGSKIDYFRKILNRWIASVERGDDSIYLGQGATRPAGPLQATVWRAWLAALDELDDMRRQRGLP